MIDKIRFLTTNTEWEKDITDSQNKFFASINKVILSFITSTVGAATGIAVLVTIGCLIAMKFDKNKPALIKTIVAVWIIVLVIFIVSQLV